MAIFQIKKPNSVKIEEKKTVGDIVGESGNVKFNYTKFQQYKKKCEEEKTDEICKRELREIGIEFD